MNVRMPDGTIIQNVPEGTTKAELLAKYTRFKSLSAATDEVTSPWQAAAIAAGRAFDEQARGLREGMPPFIREPIDKLGRALGMAEPPSIDPAQKEADTKAYAALQGKFPKSTMGGEIAERFMAPNLAGQVGLALAEPGTWDERAVRGLFTFGAGKAGEAAGSYVAGKLANRAANKTPLSPIQNTAQEALDAGYKLPPAHVNPNSWWNQLLEGISGKLKTQQRASMYNQKVSDNLAKAAIGLPDDVPLSREAIKGVRQEAGKVYGFVSNLGKMESDDAFHAARNQIFAQYKQVASEFPSQTNKALEALEADLTKDGFTSRGIVELVKRLRHDGHMLLRKVDLSPEDRALAIAKLQAQEALEDLVERNMQQFGLSIEPFQKARVLIAKTYTVEKALKESTGSIDARKIGRAFSSGRPLTGELERIGKTAEAFPKAMQSLDSSVPPFSPLDYFAGMMGFSAHPVAGAAMLARPAIRSALLSGPYQRNLLTPSAGERLIALAAKHPEELRLGGLLSGIAALQSSQ